MKRYKARKQKIPWFMTKKCIVVQLVVLFLLIHGLFNIHAKRSEALQEYEVVKEEYDTVQRSYNDLETQVELLGTEYGEEKVLRHTYGVVKPGEKVYSILEEDAYTPELLPIVEERTWWQKIWYGDE